MGMVEMEELVPELHKNSNLKKILAIGSLTFALMAILVMNYLPKHLHRDTCVFYRRVILYGVLGPSIASVTLGALFLIWEKVDLTSRKTKKMSLILTAMTVAAIVVSVWVAQREFFLPRIRSISYRMLCGQNLKNLGEAIFAYADENDGMFPTGSQWCDLLLEHTDVSEEDFICGDSFWPVFSYAFNKNLDGMRVRDVPPDTVLLFEIEGGRNVSGGPELMFFDRHGYLVSVVLYVDGYAEIIKKKWSNELKWEVPKKRAE